MVSSSVEEMRSQLRVRVWQTDELFAPRVLVMPHSAFMQGRATQDAHVTVLIHPVRRYMLTNFPLRHAALSPDGDDVAVAGSRGLALYSRRSARWRLFGDVSQVLIGSTRRQTNNKTALRGSPDTAIG